jgi:hypothetical protein
MALMTLRFKKEWVQLMSKLMPSILKTVNKDLDKTIEKIESREIKIDDFTWEAELDPTLRRKDS